MRLNGGGIALSLFLAASCLSAQAPQHIQLANRFDALVTKNKALSAVAPQAPISQFQAVPNLVPVQQQALSQQEKQELINTWKKLLAEMESTKELNKFFLNPKNKIPITIRDWKKGTVGEYEDGWIVINQQELLLIMKEAKSQGASDAQALNHAALKTFSTFAHELQHAVSEKEMEEKCGSHYCSGSIQEEVLAHTLQAEVIKELKNKKGKEWLSYKVDLDKTLDAIVQAADTDSMEAYVRRNYSSISWFNTDLKALAEKYEKAVKVGEGKIAETKQAIASASDTAEKNKYQARLKQMEDFMKEITNDLAILKDPAKVQAIQNFYKEKLDQLAKSQTKNR